MPGSVARLADSRQRCWRTLRARTNKSAPQGALLQILFMLVALCFAPARANTGAIFMYHHVSPSVEPGPYDRALTVTPSEFEQQLRWLRGHGCQLVTVDQVWSDTLHAQLAPCEAALTFDDGYADVATYAIPLLARFGATGTLYIATGFVGSPDHMTVAELRAAQLAGNQIGAHTVNHVDLTKLPYTSAYHEIGASAASLRMWLSSPVSTFAYPSGKFNQTIADAVRKLHFTDAVTTNPGHLAASESPYGLPRYRIVHGEGLRLLAHVFPQAAGATAEWETLTHVARERIAGNDPQTAEAIAVALLARKFPEQILKVNVVTSKPTTVAGIVLSGVKFHAAVDRGRFERDVQQMVGTAFSVAPPVAEVDVWATVPIQVRSGAIVSGDYATPTAKTVFSAAVVRAARADQTNGWNLGVTYWDQQWL